MKERTIRKLFKFQPTVRLINHGDLTLLQMQSINSFWQSLQKTNSMKVQTKYFILYRGKGWHQRLTSKVLVVSWNSTPPVQCRVFLFKNNYNSNDLWKKQHSMFKSTDLGFSGYRDHSPGPDLASTVSPHPAVLSPHISHITTISYCKCSHLPVHSTHPSTFATHLVSMHHTDGCCPV